MANSEQLPDDLDEATEKKFTQAEVLIRYASEAELFHTPDGDTHATMEVGGHGELAAEEPALRTVASPAVLRGTGQGSRQPGSHGRQEYHRGPCHVRGVGAAGVHSRRQARHRHLPRPLQRPLGGGGDHSGRVADDFKRTDARQVRSKKQCRRTSEPGKGRNHRTSAPFAQLRTGEDFRLLVAWIIGTFNPEGPYPCLALQGEQGSAKSTTVRVLRSVIDPAEEPLRAPPRNERDLAIAASGNWTPALDNISGIKPWLSDGLCRLATGGGFATRELYSDDQEVLFSQKRPVILNGIYNLAVAGDLRDRSIVLELPRISEEKRRSEMQFYRELEEARPTVLGALLDAVSVALLNLERVKLREKPRMADFAIWVTAAEEALGWEPGAFMRAYTGNRHDADAAALDVDPVAVAVTTLMRHRDEWAGTATELLQELGRKVDDDMKRSKAWPKGSNSLAEHLKRLAPTLRGVGIEYDGEGRTGHAGTRVKTLRKIDPEKDRQHRQQEENPPRANGKHADDGARGADDGLPSLPKNTRSPLDEPPTSESPLDKQGKSGNYPTVSVVDSTEHEDVEEF